MLLSKVNILARLQQSIAAVCPIVGVSIGTFGQSATVRIDFDTAATAQQQTAAQNVVNTFDWSDTAQAVWALTQERTDAAAQVVSTNDQLARLFRAVASVLVNEINALRDRLTAQDGVVASATTLADLKTKWAAMATARPMPDRTLVQAKASVQAAANSAATD